MREKVLDALILATIKTVSELEAIVIFIDRSGLAQKLREAAERLEKLSMLENDLGVIKRRLRGSLSTDPDKTPRAISVKDLPVVDASETKLEEVPDPYRRLETRPGLGLPEPKPPLPKKRD